MDPWPFPPERSDGYIQRLWASFNVDQKRSYLNEKEAAASANMVGESTGNADEPQPKRHCEGENAGRMCGGRNRGGIGRGATPGQTKVRARQDHRLSGGPESTPARPPLEHSQTNIPIDPRLTRADERHGVTSVSAGSRYSTPFRTCSVPAQPTSSRSISRSSSPDLDLASVTSQARQGRVHLPSEPCKDSGPTPSSDDSQIEQGVGPDGILLDKISQLINVGLKTGIRELGENLHKELGVDGKAPGNPDDPRSAYVSSVRNELLSRRGRTRIPVRPTKRKRTSSTDDGGDDGNSDEELNQDVRRVFIPMHVATSTRAKLTEQELTIRCDLQNVLRSQMHKCLGVKVTDRLPGPLAEGDEPRVIDAETGETALDVAFAEKVNHATNSLFLRRVVELVHANSKDELTCPVSLLDADMQVSHSVLLELAKTSFVGLQSTYKTQVDDKAASRRLKNEQQNHWRERRGQKKDWHLQAVNTFTDKYGVDPTLLLVQDYMSNEVSGPDIDSDGEIPTEDKDIWKRRVMNYGGLEGKLEDHRVLEIVRPEWRDEATSEIYHELSKFRMTSLSAKSRQQILFHRVQTNRSTDKPTMMAPYNFMIDEHWFKTKRVWKYKRETEDWGHYGDDHTPPGFPMPDGLTLLQMDEENDAQGLP
ncbi:hypothetical protein JB92DRAFT_3139205 [Gautieria morchelliformis]|nr:hypothetical protein JB92DRAFT_3139205 [Gautieria morchelliformis]